MSIITQRKQQSGTDGSAGVSGKGKDSSKFKESPPSFKFQKVFARVVLSSAVFVIVYFTSKKEKISTFAGINEFVHLREHKFDCMIESYQIDPEVITPCIAASCGRFATDKLFSETEIDKLKLEAGRILKKVSKSDELSSLTVEYNEENILFSELKTDIKSMLPKMLETLSQRFDVPYDSISLSQQQSYLARITNVTTEFSERLHVQHHDTEADKTSKFSLIIFLSTLKSDFTNGKLIFSDIEKGKKKSSIIDGKVGRTVGFTAGAENNYSFEKIGQGSMNFIKLSFSCKL